MQVFKTHVLIAAYQQSQGAYLKKISFAPAKIPGARTPNPKWKPERDPWQMKKWG